MDDQALIRAYGNTDLPEETAESPLVTFALFAYNQEQYIREAVEGAFSQTYSPLEIILSDDCSSDRTFEIMQEMAASYVGPHNVVVSRNERNLGLIDHINLKIQSATEEFVIFAAGDDISEPMRTQKIIDRFLRDPSIMLVHSTCQPIGTSDELRGPKCIDSNVPLCVLAKSASIYVGATGAMRKSLYRTFGSIEKKATYEDLIIGFRAALIGKISHINEPLVRYRVDTGISSEYRRKVLPRREARKNYLLMRAATLEQRSIDMQKIDHPRKLEIIKIIEQEILLVRARVLFYTRPYALVRAALNGNIYIVAKAVSSESKYVLGIID